MLLILFEIFQNQKKQLNLIKVYNTILSENSLPSKVHGRKNCKNSVIHKIGTHTRKSE